MAKKDLKNITKQSNYELKQFKHSTNQFEFVSKFNHDAKGILFISALMTLSVIAGAAAQIEYHNSNVKNNLANNIQDKEILSKTNEYSNFVLGIVHPGTMVKSGNVYSINAEIQENSLQDKKNLEKAYYFSDRSFTSLFNHNKWNINKLVHEFIKLNGYIVGGKGKFRDGEMIVKKARDIDCPDLLNVPDMISYLKDKPELYREYVAFVNKFGELQNSPFTANLPIKYYMTDILSSPVEDDAKKFLSKYYDYIDSTPEQIKEQIRDLFKHLKTIINEDPVEAAAYCAIKIAEIHPFTDGNGRVARFIENEILKGNGIPIVAHLNGRSYDEAVRNSLDNNNIDIYKNHLLGEIAISQKILNNQLHKGNEIETALRLCMESFGKFNKNCWSVIQKLIDSSEENFSKVNEQNNPDLLVGEYYNHDDIL